MFSLVANVPMMFITKYGADLGMKASDCAFALSLVFAGSIISTYVSGWSSDRGFSQGMMGCSAVATSTIHVIVWGFSKTRIAVFTYSLAIGIVGGGKLNATRGCESSEAP